MLHEMDVPADYDASKLVILENAKTETTEQIIEKVLAELPGETFSKNVATWLKDKSDSELTSKTLEAFK